MSLGQWREPFAFAANMGFHIRLAFATINQVMPGRWRVPLGGIEKMKRHTARLTIRLGPAAIALLFLAGNAAAYSVTHNGGSYYTFAYPPTYQWTNDPNATCFQFNNGDTMTFTDLLVLNNVNGNVASSVKFSMNIYQWVGGARGAKLAGTWTQLVAAPGQTATGTNQLTVTYTNWNGPNSCWTFEVSRGMDDGIGAAQWFSVVY